MTTRHDPGPGHDDHNHGHDHEQDHGHEHDHPHDHEHDHPHDNGRKHGHDHPHGHGHEHDHDDAHPHEHPGGLRGWLHEIFVPHSHDASDSIDDALEASALGIRTVRLSLVILGITAVAQLGVVAVSGSVALLADTIHNFSDALTAIPLWIAFSLGRRAPTRRFTFGFGRVEDLAGLFVVAMIALSAVLAGVESVRRLADPPPLENLGWVFAAGVIGFLGNEAVALYRIRTGRRIGSAALVADGVHARTDGFTSLAVVLGVVGVWLGFPLADPLVGLLITVAIVILLVGTARDVGRRLLDGVDPDLVSAAEHALEHVPGITAVSELRVRWAGHRLTVQATVEIEPGASLADADRVAGQAREQLGAHLPGLGHAHVAVRSAEVQLPT